MTSSWVTSMCKALRETDVPQIHGDLIRFTDEYNWKDESVPEIEGKCALGVLSCDVAGLKLSYVTREFRHEDILVGCGVPTDLIEDNALPRIRRDLPFGENTDYEWYISMPDVDGVMDFDEMPYGMGMNIDVMIYTLNDSGLTFHELADFIETTFGDCEDV